MSKRFVIILAALFVLFAGVLFFSKRSDSNSEVTIDESAGSSHIEGEGTSGVTLLEFGDFQCPACKSYYPIVKAVKSEFGDKIKFQFRNFPLTNIHPNAMAAHRAAEAAGRQGKFFEMHDLLYERQDSWSTSQNPTRIFEDYATELGLNIDQFREDMASQSVLNVINTDLKLGQDLELTATPSFILNGKKLDPAPNSADKFIQAINDAISEQESNQ